MGRETGILKFSFSDLSDELKETVEAIFKKAKRIDPQLDEKEFFTRIFYSWLKPYCRQEIKTLDRNKVILRNRLPEILAMYEISCSQLSRKIGISRSYLYRVIKQEYTPTITVAYLICLALGMDISKVTEIFYLEIKD